MEMRGEERRRGEAKREENREERRLEGGARRDK